MLLSACFAEEKYIANGYKEQLCQGDTPAYGVSQVAAPTRQQKQHVYSANGRTHRRNICVYM
jgi:hypothetical protein